MISLEENISRNSSMRKKSTKEAKARRVEQVIQLLSMGVYRWEIVNKLSAEWECSERNVEKYLTVCYNILAKQYDEHTLETILSKYELLYRRALNRGDDKLAVRVLDSIAKVKQLYVERVQHSGEVSYKVKFPTKNKSEDNVD